ncbi:hypothetical protein HDU98_004002, partial [Podochytrium sp. JEL0797]
NPLDKSDSGVSIPLSGSKRDMPLAAATNQVSLWESLADSSEPFWSGCEDKVYDDAGFRAAFPPRNNPWFQTGTSTEKGPKEDVDALEEKAKPTKPAVPAVPMMAKKKRAKSPVKREGGAKQMPAKPRVLNKEK